MTRRSVPPAAAFVAAGVLALAAAGCGAAGEGRLESAGPTPTAVGPVRLWPDLPPATNPPIDYGETDNERVPGIAVAAGDVHTVDPLAVVRAEVRAHPDTVAGPNGVYAGTVRAIGACAGGAGSAGCPLMEPYYHDLTGDGRDELIAGIRLPDQQVAVLVYRAEQGGLTRVLSTVEQVISVELAGRDLIMRVGSAGIPGYEYRTAWSWDEDQGSMLPTRDEIVRVRPPGSVPSVAAPSAPPTPPATPRASPPPVAPVPAPEETAPEETVPGSVPDGTGPEGTAP
ncbi:hypothetical protein [Streptomyces sp. NPDC058855]|uniref:hypothetical protein n=1 Tax=Streptomyces sp. NPDC058855 TaxID=3346651 RepID=UPI00367CF90F